MYMGEVIEAAPMPSPAEEAEDDEPVNPAARPCPGRKEEEQGGQDQHLLAAEAVAQEAGQTRPHAQPSNAQAAAKPFPNAGRAEMLLQEADGPGDHRRVVAEQQPAQAATRVTKSDIDDAAAALFADAIMMFPGFCPLGISPVMLSACRCARQGGDVANQIRGLPDASRHPPC